MAERIISRRVRTRLGAAFARLKIQLGGAVNVGYHEETTYRGCGL